MTLRLAALVSHPIQYQAPLFRQVAGTPGVDLTVFFLSDHGVKAAFDTGFGRAVQFDVPLLEGYEHRFLRNRAPKPSVATSTGLVNPAIVTELVQGRFDALWVHGYAHVSDWLGFAAAAAVRTPILLRGETTTLYETPPSRRLAKRLVLGPLVRHAGGLLYVGAENRRFYESLGARPEQLFFAPYSVDNAYFAAKAETARTDGTRERLRAQAGAGPDDVLLLFVGKLLARKRPTDLVDAVARLGEAGTRAVIAFIGEGEERAALEQAIAKAGVRARILGFANQSELPGWYAASDLFVLPSVHETWGLVVNEAMACGLPAIVSDKVGCGYDLCATTGAGAVHGARDPASLAAAIAPFLADADRRRNASQRALAVVSGYDVSVTAAGVVEALRAVAKR
jgi:glycosyltransferase involved in cell wall biosynthesis